MKQIIVLLLITSFSVFTNVLAQSKEEAAVASAVEMLK